MKLTKEYLKSEIGDFEIQFDLKNNALVYLTNPDKYKNLQLLETYLRRKFSEKKINEIIVIESFRVSDIRYLHQKKVIDYTKGTINSNYNNKFESLMNIEGPKRELVQLSLNNEIIPDKIDTLQYRGNKSQILDFLIPFFKGYNSVLDLMAGSQSVSLALKKQCRIISNDVQYFSFILGKAYIENNDFERIKIIPKELIKKKSGYDIFQRVYSNIYFTPQQAIEIDKIRATIDEIRKYNKILYYCYLSCLIQCLDLVARTAGHFDGALDIKSKKVKERENKSVYEEFCKKIRSFRTYKSKYDNRCHNLTAENLLKEEKISDFDIIYIDPPYNHRQYSRYYHILETCARYNKEIRYNNKGLYPEYEYKSDFCYHDKVESAFRNIIALASNKARYKVLLSYSNRGLLDCKRLYDICKEYCKKVKVFEKRITYTKQKTSFHNETQKEILFELNLSTF